MPSHYPCCVHSGQQTQHFYHFNSRQHQTVNCNFFCNTVIFTSNSSCFPSAPLKKFTSAGCILPVFFRCPCIGVVFQYHLNIQSLNYCFAFSLSITSPLYEGVQQNKDNKQSDAGNFILTFMYTWQVGSRWYTSDLHLATIGI